MVEVPGSGSQWSPGGGGFMGPGSYYYRQEGLGWRSMSPEARVSILALSTLAAGPIGIMAGGGRLAMFVWKIRLPVIAYAALSASSGGGGPGEVLTSAAPPSITSGGAPPSVEGLGRLIISAHGGGRSGAKPRKRCPKGHHWNARVGRCMPDFIGWKRGPYRKG